MPAPLWAAGPMLAMFADLIPGCVPVLPRGPSPAQVAYFRASAALGRSHNLCVGGGAEAEVGIRSRNYDAREGRTSGAFRIMVLERRPTSSSAPPRPRSHLGLGRTSASASPRPPWPHLGLVPTSASAPPRPRPHLGLGPTSASVPPRPRPHLGLGHTSASAPPRPRLHLGLGRTSASAPPRPRDFQIFSDIFRYFGVHILFF